MQAHIAWSCNVILELTGAVDQHMLRPAGPEAHALARLFWVYTGLLAAVAALVIATVALAIWRRRSVHANSEPPTLAASERPAAPTETATRALDAQAESRRGRKVVFSVVATVIALVVLLVESVSTSNALDALRGRESVHVQITGKKWWWQVRYVDGAPALAFTTANELRVPVGREIRVDLAAADVIHSFWAPNLHGKRDLIPGHDTSLTFRVDRPGRFRAQCAEFCGSAHAQMALWIVAQKPADYEAWRQNQSASAREPSTELERAGQHVFMKSACALCHTVRGTSAGGGLGPDLTHLASRSYLAAASYPNRRGFLAGWLLGAQALKPHSQMPDLTLPAADLHALVAYLEALR